MLGENTVYMIIGVLFDTIRGERPQGVKPQGVKPKEESYATTSTGEVAG